MRCKARIVAALMLTVLLVAGCSRGAGTGTGAAVTTEDVTVTFVATQLPPGVGASIAKGDELRLKSNHALLGTVESVEVSPTPVVIGDAQGDVHVSGTSLTEDARITLTGKAAVSAGGYVFGGTAFYINQPDDFVTATTALHGSITSMTPAGK